ncbi:MAG: porin [bacterium]
MKRITVVGFLVVIMALPAWSAAEVESVAGNITLHGHIDFVYRNSEADEKIKKDGPNQEWNGYDTMNLETAILGMSGTVGDNVSWLVSYAFAFRGPAAAADSEAVTDDTNNNSAGALLDAQINIRVADMMELSFGRFIPPTSMTWAPHQMSAFHTVNYPLIHGSGIAPGQYAHIDMLTLPRYQTGVMLSASMGPAKIMLGGFNGSEYVGGDETDIGDAEAYGLDNTMDIDRNKGLLAKVAVDQEGMHFGGWYYAEDAAIEPEHLDGYIDTRPADGNLVQWGIEAAYNANNLLVAVEYLQSTFDAEDSAVDDNLVQSGWYFLAGYTMNRFQVVARYDYVNYDMEEMLLDDRHDVSSSDYNEESAITAGVNYLLNEQTTVGLNYTWRDLENYEPAADELAVIVEVDLF